MGIYLKKIGRWIKQSLIMLSYKLKMNGCILFVMFCLQIHPDARFLLYIETKLISRWVFFFQRGISKLQVFFNCFN